MLNKLLLNLKLKKEFLHILYPHSNKLEMLNVECTGYREFYADGSSLSIEINKKWYQTLQNGLFKTGDPMRCVQALAEIGDQNFHIAVNENISSPSSCLSKIFSCDPRADLLVYTKTKNIISQYSFSTVSTTISASSLLMHKRQDFVDLTSSCQDGLSKVFAQSEYSSLRRPLFSECVAKKLFYLLDR